MTSSRLNTRVPYVVGALILVLVMFGIWLMGGKDTDPQAYVKKETLAVVPPENTVAKRLSPKDAKGLLENQSVDTNLVILDVRTPEEFAEGHLSGAIQMNYYDADIQDKIRQLDRTKSYLIYCRTGKRSGEFIKIMEPLGFSQIHEITGGFSAWNQAGFPSVK